jgi:tetratricopeptide (TPR) repeat protein
VWSLVSLAEIDVTIGAAKQDVEKTLNTAKILFHALDFPQGVTSCEMISAELHLTDGDLVVAKDLVQKCLKLHWEKWSNASGVSYCLERLADVSRWSLCDVEWSFSWAVIYLAHSHKLQQRLFLHTALRLLSEIFLIKSDQETAHSLLILALEGFTQMDVHRGRAQCMLRLGDIAAHQGDFTQAIQFWKDSQPLFERSLQTRLAAAVDRRLLAATHGKALGDYQTWIFRAQIAPE